MVVREQRFSFNEVRQALGAVLGEDMHAKRVDSLSGATLGVLRSASRAVCAIGQGLAAAPGGRARVLRSAAVTADRYKVGTVVCVQDPDMKSRPDAWPPAAPTPRPGS